MGRHLRLFEGHVLAHHWIVLLQFQFALRRALVLLRVVRKTSTGGRNEANVFAHSGPLVPRPGISGKRLTQEAGRWIVAVTCKLEANTRMNR